LNFHLFIFIECCFFESMNTNMKYIHYIEKDFIEDEYFQKWVLDSDSETRKYWENWILEHPEKKETVESAAHIILQINFDHSDQLSDENFDAMWQNISRKKSESNEDNTYKTRPILLSKKRYVLKAAAVFIGVIGITYGLLRLSPFQKEQIVPVLKSTQITLKLEDGRIRTLDESSSGIVTNSNGQTVVHHDQNTLIYKKKGSTRTTVAYNELTVPNGKKFELILSDGSHVILNSGSKLRYPVVFLEGKPRNVFLDGEAYFSVEKDESRRFIVETDNMTTEVYGTIFNVSSYSDESNTSTVLVEGSVGVYGTKGKENSEPTHIVPSQRAVMKQGAISIDEVDVSKHIAWTEGRLLFVDDPFETIIKELERHFDVKINSQVKKLNQKRFTGTFTNETIDQILLTFQEHTAFNYEIHANTITIGEKVDKDSPIKG